ncbi:MAG: hypothetical protein ACI8XX_000912 [Polaribacter sp.]|jgi:hypothetical protein
MLPRVTYDRYGWRRCRFGGEKNGPFILNIVTPAHPCARDIPFILNIVTPAHPCARDIPFILNIKKALSKCLWK